MIALNDVFRRLHLADPFPMTEPALRAQISADQGNRPIGTGDLADTLKRLESKRWAVQSLDDESNTLWGLTPLGRTVAADRFA